MILFASCASDNDEACYFKMETEQTQVNVPAAGISKSKLAKVIIRSNKDWNIQLEILRMHNGYISSPMKEVLMASFAFGWIKIPSSHPALHV